MSPGLLAIVSVHSGLQDLANGNYNLFLSYTCRAGKMADFVVLDGDPLQMKEDGSGIPSVLQTFVAGECQYGCHRVL